MDGISWDRYLQLTWYERYVMHDELSDLIERTEGEPPPRQLRK
jgi:hypothetical protein